MSKEHICICVCTFKRPQMLKRFLHKTVELITNNDFTFSIVIADNDKNGTAQKVVEVFKKDAQFPVIYCIEPKQNIAKARNKVISNATGNYLAFIDDDELPEPDWLLNLYTACKKYNVDGVLGPVKPLFEHEAPKWVTKGKFFDRPEFETGHKMTWYQTRTGNVLIKSDVLDGLDPVFNPEFGTGSEDVDFFKRMIDSGKKFIWCNKAVVYEIVPKERCTRRYQIKYSLLRGANSLKHKRNNIKMIIKSIIAIPVYTIALPFLRFGGDHLYTKYLIKLFDHIGRFACSIGIKLIKERGL